MSRLAAILLACALPLQALAQGAPAPPTYPPDTDSPTRPVRPAPPAPVSPRPLPHELGLAGAELAAGAGVTVGATLALASALGNAGADAAAGATAQVALLLYLALIPMVSSLPVWLIGLLSDHYEPRLGPAIEGGSAVATAALLVLMVTNGSRGGLLAGGGLLFVGMPLTEVLAMNLSKSPKPSVNVSLAPPLLEPSRGEVLVSLPPLTF